LSRGACMGEATGLPAADGGGQPEIRARHRLDGDSPGVRIARLDPPATPHHPTRRKTLTATPLAATPQLLARGDGACYTTLHNPGA
jgi:hypothetical protein